MNIYIKKRKEKKRSVKKSSSQFALKIVFKKKIFSVASEILEAKKIITRVN
jgi:hypothetical protein